MLDDGVTTLTSLATDLHVHSHHSQIVVHAVFCTTIPQRNISVGPTPCREPNVTSALIVLISVTAESNLITSFSCIRGNKIKGGLIYNQHEVMLWLCS